MHLMTGHGEDSSLYSDNNYYSKIIGHQAFAVLYYKRLFSSPLPFMFCSFLLCGYARVHVYHCACPSQRATCRSWVSPSTMCGEGLRDQTQDDRFGSKCLYCGVT